MKTISLDYKIVDLKLLPIIQEFLKYKYPVCVFDEKAQAINGVEEFEIVNAINDVRILAILCVGNINK